MDIQSIPTIISAKTYFWSSAQGASSRRRNETKRKSEVADFFKKLKFKVEIDGDNVNGILQTKKDKIEIQFSYSESCKNVYKNFKVWKNDNKSNISTIKKLLK